jgi:hypothetical protein
VTALDVLLGTQEVCELCVEGEDKEEPADTVDHSTTRGNNDTVMSDPDWHPTMETER